jgi:hypothetical protein
MRGARGQSFLKEMLAAFDALPERKLIASGLEVDGNVCALGAVGKARAMDMRKIDPDDHEGARNETPEQRYERMRRWVDGRIRSAHANHGNHSWR